MNFKMVHNNINVFNLEKSIEFYEKALGLKVIRRKEHPDGDFIIVYLGNDTTDYRLELTWLRDKKEPYNLGDNEIHLAFITEEFDEAYNYHKENNWICYENKNMGIYFIADPDGYWMEVVPASSYKA